MDRTRRTLQARLAQSLTGTVDLRLHWRPDAGSLILPDGLGCATCDTAEDLARALQEVAPTRSPNPELAPVAAEPNDRLQRVAARLGTGASEGGDVAHCGVSHAPVIRERA